jgi:hypothetical protein
MLAILEEESHAMGDMLGIGKTTEAWCWPREVRQEMPGRD